MSFVWNPNPNSTTPPPILPVPVGDGEMSYEAKEVANTVNVDPIYGVGTLLWNIATPPDAGDNGLFGDFDIIYRLPSLNVKDVRATHLEADNVTVYFNATINTANIGAATINTANIVNATIANGRMGVNPTANLQIATKEYVDSLAANSVPLGGNLQLLILAAGDLLVGVSDNTAERLPIGANNGGVLIADTSQNTGVRWSTRSVGPTATHRGLFMGTAFDELGRNNQVQIVNVDEIIMDDGLSVRTGWNRLTANIRSNVATSGVGFLDTGVVKDNTCYEVWAIRSSTNGAQGLILHRTLDRLVGAQIDTSVGLTVARKIRYEHGFGSISCVNIAQSFVSTKSGPLTSVECALNRTGTLTGNLWLSLQSNTASGNPSGVYLARSRNVNIARVSTTTAPAPRMRFIFDTTANVEVGTSYWAVIEADFPTSHNPVDNDIQIWGVASGASAYANGVAKNFLSNTNTWVVANTLGFNPIGPPDIYFRTFVEANNTDLVMPAGYDQKCLLSYVFTDFRSNTREYRQRDHTMTMAYSYTWVAVYNGGTGQPVPGSGAEQAFGTLTSSGLVVVNLGGYVPPVPCLVSFYHYGQSAEGAGAFAALESTDSMDGSNQQKFVYSRGTLNANLLQTGDGTQKVGPVLIEQQAVLVNYTSVAAQVYIAEMEF